MSSRVDFQDRSLYGQQPRMPANQKQDRFFQGRVWSDDEKRTVGGTSWDIPNEYSDRDPDLSRVFARTRFREIMPPTNYPIDASFPYDDTHLSRFGQEDVNKRYGTFDQSSYPSSDTKSLRSTRKDPIDLPSRRSLDNRIPKRDLGETEEAYFARVGYPKPISYPTEETYVPATTQKKYSMPSGRLADGVNAIYQPDGRWVSSGKGLVFEQGQVVDGKFVPSKPSDKTNCWTCGGIMVATLVAVTAVALGVLASGQEIDLKSLGLS